MSDSPIRVLLVEDNELDVEACRRQLGRTKGEFEILLATSLANAIGNLDASRSGSQKRIDVVLLDLGLPDGAGLTNIEAIRNADATVPIVVLTGWDEAFMDRVVSAGAEQFISKSAEHLPQLKEKIKAAAEEGLRRYSTPSDEKNSDSKNEPEAEPELAELSLQLRLLCSDLVINHPEVERSPELHSIRRIAKRIYDATRDLDEISKK